MKVIVSHDIDHLTASEHLRDLIVPKHIVRSLIELGLGYATVAEMGNRLEDILENRLHNLEALLKFDKAERVPSTYFVAVSKGKGLAYGLDHASWWIRVIKEQGFDIGVHGISFDKSDEMKREWTMFKELSGMSDFGIRMHYLRGSESILQNLSKIGYAYDSSVSDRVDPYKVENMWEFPLHIMDGRIFCFRRRWQDQKLSDAKDSTRRALDYLSSQGISFCTVCFHDMHFSDSFKDWKDWYVWLIRYLKDNNEGLVSFDEAIGILEGSR